MRNGLHSSFLLCNNGKRHGPKPFLKRRLSWKLAGKSKNLVCQKSSLYEVMSCYYLQNLLLRMFGSSFKQKKKRNVTFSFPFDIWSWTTNKLVSWQRVCLVFPCLFHSLSNLCFAAHFSWNRWICTFSHWGDRRPGIMPTGHGERCI